VQSEFFSSYDFSYRIIDLTGKILQFGKLDHNEQNQIIDFKNSKEGIFFIQIYSTKKHYTSKLLIKK